MAFVLFHAADDLVAGQRKQGCGGEQRRHDAAGGHQQAPRTRRLPARISEHHWWAPPLVGHGQVARSAVTGCNRAALRVGQNEAAAVTAIE